MEFQYLPVTLVYIPCSPHKINHQLEAPPLSVMYAWAGWCLAIRIVNSDEQVSAAALQSDLLQQPAEYLELCTTIGGKNDFDSAKILQNCPKLATTRKEFDEKC